MPAQASLTVPEELVSSHDADPPVQIISPRDEGRFGDYSNVEVTKLPINHQQKRNRKLIVLTFCTSNFFVGTFFALLAPFFAAEVGWVRGSVRYISPAFPLTAQDLLQTTDSPVSEESNTFVKRSSGLLSTTTTLYVCAYV